MDLRVDEAADHAARRHEDHADQRDAAVQAAEPEVRVEQDRDRSEDAEQHVDAEPVSQSAPERDRADPLAQRVEQQQEHARGADESERVAEAEVGAQVVLVADAGAPRRAAPRTARPKTRKAAPRCVRSACGSDLMLTATSLNLSGEASLSVSGDEHEAVRGRAPRANWGNSLQRSRRASRSYSVVAPSAVTAVTCRARRIPKNLPAIRCVRFGDAFPRLRDGVNALDPRAAALPRGGVRSSLARTGQQRGRRRSRCACSRTCGSIAPGRPGT